MSDYRSDASGSASGAPGSDPVLDVKQLSMTFPGTRALQSVDFQVLPGEVHALVGHNGSGKSTLIKILSGAYTPDRGGVVRVSGEDLPFGSPADSERLGVRVVHQNLGLVPALSITENIAMGSGYSSRNGVSRIRWSQEHASAAAEMAGLGYPVDPRQPVGKLPSAARSAVAVARALRARDGRPRPRMVLLDEVTAAMPEHEVGRILELVRNLQAQGIAVVYVSHHLEEVLEVCQQVTILRNGECVVSAPAGSMTLTSLADLVVGTTDWRERAPADVSQAESATPTPHRLTVSGLAGPTLRGLSFTAGPGRIIGIAGLTGSGRDEVAPLLFGALPRSGSIELNGTPLPANSPRASVAAGVTMLPADRLGSAVIPRQTVRESLALSGLGRQRGLALLDHRRQITETESWIAALGIRGARVDTPVEALSGGNQQKVMLARCLNTSPEVLLLDEPTQGVDIGAVADIHDRIRAASETTAVVVCSSNTFELASLCTEVITLYRGVAVGHLRGDEITEDHIDRLQLSAGPSDLAEPATTLKEKHVNVH